MHIDCFFARPLYIASVAEWKWQAKHLWTCCKSASKSPCHTAVQHHCHLDPFFIGSKLRCSSCNVMFDLTWLLELSVQNTASWYLTDLVLSKWLALEPLHRHRLHVRSGTNNRTMTMDHHGNHFTMPLSFWDVGTWASIKKVACGSAAYVISKVSVISEVRTRDSMSKGWCKEQALGFGITSCCTRPS